MNAAEKNRPDQPRLTAVIACHRDGPAVPVMYRRLCDVFQRLGVDYEIVFVNDCSPDNAAEVLAELARRDRRVVVISHSRNFGSQAAFTSGMRVSTGDAVILLDGDLQDPPELIESFYREWRRGADVVYGVRVNRETSTGMKWACKGFYRLFRRLASVSIPLDAGDFSLLDRRVVDVLNALPERNRFLRGLRAWAGFRQCGVPYVRPERMFGRSTNNLLRNIGWARQAIVSFSYVPLDLIAGLGIVTVAGALIALVAQATLVGLVLFVGGVQLLSLGVIGSYIAHIYDEVKRRPPYVVDQIINRPAPRLTARESHPTPREHSEMAA